MGFLQRLLSPGALSGACVLALFIGCANPRVTRDSYTQIHEHMPMEQVEQILGAPSYKHKERCYYKGTYGTIRIKVKNGCVDDVDWKD